MGNKRKRVRISDAVEVSDGTRRSAKAKGKAPMKQVEEDDIADTHEDPDEFEELDDDQMDAKIRNAKSARKSKRFSEDGLEVGDDVTDFRKVAEEAGEECTEAFTEEGVRVEPFNLRQEMEEGHFDANGMYVEKKEKEVDAWLDHYDKKYGKKGDEDEYAQTLAKKKEADILKSQNYEEAEEVNVDDARKTIASILEDGETVVQALRRLKPQTKTKKQPPTKKPLPGQSNLTDEEKKKKFDELTEAADKLMSTGDHNVYSFDRQKFEELLKPKVQWMYKWSHDDTEYGPYPTSHVADWLSKGYFSMNGASVVVRKADDKAQANAKDLLNDLDSDDDEKPDDVWTKIDDVDLTQYR